MLKIHALALKPNWQEVSIQLIGDEAGDKIYYDRIAGHNIELNDNVYKVIQEIDVIIVL